MVLSDALAIVVGRLLGSQLPEKAVKWTAATIFLGFGAWGAWEGGQHLSPIAWVLGGIAVAAASWWFFLRESSEARPENTEPQA
jgi:hypothetical protein